MLFNDLREFISEVERLGECKVIKGADWDLEIGAITELEAASSKSPLLLFDEIKGYRAGYRVASNLFTTPLRTALALNLPKEARGTALVEVIREREKEGVKLIPPVEVKDAPVKENVHLGDEIDLYEFPSPKWNELDGGRYIGTGAMTIIRDPDEGWVNLAAQRVQIHGKDKATIIMAPGRHSIIVRQKYWDRGLSCPVAVACGQEPLLWSMSTRRPSWGVSEYDFAGGLRGEPVQVTKGVTTDLPIPATAEIVLEGEIVPPGTETVVEGPFGEWLGYYASMPTPEPVFRVKSILHRNDPIIQGNPPTVLPPIWTVGWHIQKAAVLWNELDRQVSGVKGVWMIDEDACQSIPVISIKQEFEGHAAQVAMIAAGCSEISAWAACRYIIVVDDDIDPTNVSEVLWALATRTDPAASIDIVRGFRSTRTDPMLSPEKKRLGEWSHSKAIINACKPYSWIKDFPPSVKSSPELLQKTREKWGKMLS
ncbi:UbiD family decarboxylase [Chloroflexota bacterium]